MRSYTLLEQEIEKIAQINNIINLIRWDISANMPSGAATSRKNELITIDSIAHSLLKSKKIGDLIQEVQVDLTTLNKWQLANLREIKKQFMIASCIEEKLQQRYVAATTECELVWRNAKQLNSYVTVKPYLQEVINTVREISTAKAEKFGITKYDALLDDYDPDRTTGETKKIFSVLKTKLPSLIEKILEQQSTELVLPISKNISIELQKAISKKLMKIMGFDFSKGRIDESAHPYCGGTPYDVRITTRYSEDFIIGIMNVIHETGHGLYEQNLPELYKNQPVGKAKGMAFHESQSLLLEMQIGRSREFCDFLSRLLRDEFDCKGREYSGDNLYKLVTRVKPDFIRTDADEVTYPLHVLVRLELEIALINGDLDLNDLPGSWNKKMQQHLGISPKSDKEGCLQDIHWYKGHFGYFPAYVNGAIIAAILMDKAKIVNSNLAQEITNGEFANLNNFLNTNIWNVGSLNSSEKLLKEATNCELNPQIFLEYLDEKYSS